MNLKNIAWYSRGGHLDLFCKLNLKLKTEKQISKSHFICHTVAEEKKIKKTYSYDPVNLGKYLNTKKKSFNFDQKRIDELSREYDFISLKKILLSEIIEKKFSEKTLIFNLVSHFDFWENFLKKNNINFIFSEGPSFLSTCVLWTVCQKLGVECVSFGNWSIDGRLVFNKEWSCQILGFEEKYKNLVLDQSSLNYKLTTEYLSKMQNNPSRPRYVSMNLTTGKKGKPIENPFPKFPSIKKILSFRKKIRENKINHYMNKSNWFKNYLKWILKVTRIFYHKFFNLFEKNLNLNQESYFIYPMHILNEWQNHSHMGLKYSKIMNLIEECSLCMPIGHKLYVKEHPSFFPQKNRSFYKSIKTLKNVRLIHPNEDNFKLIKKSEGIITTAGTMGWEGYLFDKPVFMLVDHWSQILPGVHRACSPEELSCLLQNSKNLEKSTSDEKFKAVYALHESSFKGVVYPISENMSEENIKNLYEPIKNFINNGTY